MLTPKQKLILDFVTIYHRKFGVSPSYKEIGKKLKVSSPATIHQHLKALEEKGYLNRQKNQKRGIEIPKKEKLVRVPLLGAIAAGQPIEAIEIPETISIPQNYIGQYGDYYALKVKGDSMIDEGINDGDIILVRHQNTAENGQKVVALLDNSEATLKKFYKERGQIRLQPANKNIEPLIIKNGRDISIQGIVLDVIKNFNKNDLKFFNEKQNGKEIKAYKRLPLNKIILGDTIEELKKIPSESVDLILTDPPYGLNKNGVKNDYSLSTFYKSLANSYRVLKKDSFYITFFSTKFLPKIFEKNPFTYFWNFVLYSPNAKVGSPIGYTKYMSCTVFKKGNPKIKKRNKDIFVDTPGRMIEPDEGFIDHPTPKPKTFVSEIIKMFSKERDIILDPFIGSGSTAMACLQTNRNFIGIEIDKKYCELAKKRISNFKRKQTLI